MTTYLYSCPPPSRVSEQVLNPRYLCVLGWCGELAGRASAGGRARSPTAGS